MCERRRDAPDPGGPARPAMPPTAHASNVAQHPTGNVVGMSRIVTLTIGAVLILLGLLWILQGFDVIGGSGMSGHAIWAVIGIIIGVVGLVLILRTLRAAPVSDHR